MPQYAVKLSKIRSVIPTTLLLGLGGDEAPITPTHFIQTLVEHAADGAHVPQMPGDIGRLTDGTWVCQFPSTVLTQVVPLKLDVVRETWGIAIEQPEPTRIVLRRTQPGGGLWSALTSKKPAGLEVTLTLPPVGTTLGEIHITGRLFGSPSQDFAQKAQDIIPRLITDVRRELKNVDDRRQHSRIAADFAVNLYPLHSSGGIDMPLYARCRDVSRGGLCVLTDGPLKTKYSYAVIDEVPALTGFAILVRFLRSQAQGNGRECAHGGQFRTDLA